MKKIPTAFSFIFSDDDWFNKVLVGGFFLLLSPLAIGIIMLMGFQIELSKRYLRHQHDMPMWRNSSVILKNGGKLFLVSLFYATCILIVLIVIGVQIISITTAMALAISHIFLNPLLIRFYSHNDSARECLNPVKVVGQLRGHIVQYCSTISVTTALIVMALVFGWMFIVVGWPLLIFLSLIIQSIMFAQS